MATNLGNIQMNAGARQRFPVDFGNTPQLVAGAGGGVPDALTMSVNIAAKTVTCTGTGAPVVSGIQLDYPYQVSALFTAGATLGTFPVTYSITLDDVDATVITQTGTLEVV